MSHYFLNTSALSKHYLPEIGTKWMRSIIRANPGVLIISQLATVEMIALTARRQKALSLSKSATSRIRSQLKNDLNQGQYLIVDLSREAIERSTQLARKYSLRALDAIQLGCAVTLRTRLGVSIIFVASDKE